MVMVIQIVAAVLLVLGSGLVFRALVELDRTPAARTRPLRSARPAGDGERQLPRAA
jgi:hypothetical protein